MIIDLMMVLRAIERFCISLINCVLMPDPRFLLLLVFRATDMSQCSTPTVDDLSSHSGRCLVTAIPEFHSAFRVDIHFMCELLPRSIVFFTVEFSLAYSLPVGILPRRWFSRHSFDNNI